jgi:hypothetical protein
VRGHLLQLRLAGVQPPLAGERDHPDQHLGVHRGQLRVVPSLGEHVPEEVLHLARDVADQAGVGPGPGRGVRVPHQDPEPVGVVLDVPEQPDGGDLELLHGVRAAEQPGGHGQEPLHLAVHHDRVQPLLAAEVLVDHGLGHVGPGGDLLDRRAFQAALGEQAAAHVEQLLPAFLAGHPLTA